MAFLCQLCQLDKCQMRLKEYPCRYSLSLEVPLTNHEYNTSISWNQLQFTYNIQSYSATYIFLISSRPSQSASPNMRTRTTAGLTAGIMALTARAALYNVSQSVFVQPRDDDAFQLHVWNNCPWTKQVAIYGVTSNFQMVQYSDPTNIEPGHKHIINAPFHGIGLRLSGHAEWGTDGQWANQALFEFGYSEYEGQTGTAYDVSIMTGSDPDIGLGAYPIANGQGSESCKSFSCWPWYCPADQGWTDPGQVSLGSPADTVCYKGKTDFKVVWCS